jgi:hypothetical protein
MFSECNRSCEGCCNKDWDVDNLPRVDTYEGYDLIMLTGGEPMLRPMLIMQVCAEIREMDFAPPIILYTAKSRRAMDLVAILGWVDGITLTLHEQYDVGAFVELQELLSMYPDHHKKSLRLNVFSNVILDGVDTANWHVKDGIEWIDDCPLPTDEVLMRL